MVLVTKGPPEPRFPSSKEATTSRPKIPQRDKAPIPAFSPNGGHHVPQEIRLPKCNKTEYKHPPAVADVVSKVGEETPLTHIDLVLDPETEWKVDYLFPITVDWKVYAITVITSNEIFPFASSEEGKYPEHDICCNRDATRTADLPDGMKEPTK